MCENPGEKKGPIQNEDQRQGIVDFGGITARGRSGNIHCLTIIGQVEGHFILPPQNKATKYEHVMPQLVAIEDSLEIDGLLVLLNTVGGDVEAGLAIAEMLASMKKPVVSLVLGGGHSIGVPLAVASKVSFIAPSATMTIHPVRLNGIIIGVPQSFSYMERMQERIIKFVCSNSHMTPESFRKLMTNTAELASDIGTVLTGEEAVACGLIDRVGGLSDALECLASLAAEYRASQGGARVIAMPQTPAQGDGEAASRGEIARQYQLQSKHNPDLNAGRDDDIPDRVPTPPTPAEQGGYARLGGNNTGPQAEHNPDLNAGRDDDMPDRVPTPPTPAEQRGYARLGGNNTGPQAEHNPDLDAERDDDMPDRVPTPLTPAEQGGYARLGDSNKRERYDEWDMGGGK